MTHRAVPRRLARPLGAAAVLLVIIVLAPVTAAAPGDGYLGPGYRGRDFRPPEIERLERHAYDYYYRNSNRNVFRSSRHFHPTKNVFRSSRHYQRKLDASYAAYPLRTWVRFAETRGDRTRERSFNYAHPPADRYPEHRYSNAYGLEEPLLEEHLEYDEYDDYDEPHEAARAPVRAATTIEHAVIHDERHRRPTQRAVMRTETLPDGRVKTIIESVPIEDRAVAARD